MSNNNIGDVYRQVIDKVIRAAENDFEEGGYPQATLQELKRGWEQNLSKLHVGNMPWDPPPHMPAPPTQQHQQQQQGQSIKHDVKDSALSAPNGAGAQIKHEQHYDPQIKSEPRYDAEVPNYPALNGYQGNAINPMAGHRAAANMLQQFGPQANASIRAAGLPQQPRHPNGNVPQQQQQQRPPQQQQHPGQRPPQQQVPYGQNSLASAQHDGAGDDYSTRSAEDQWNILVNMSRNTSLEDRAAADDAMGRELLAMAQESSRSSAGLLRKSMMNLVAEEDSNLLIPDDERSNIKSTKPSKQTNPSSKGKGRLQVDGTEDDEDAINSDLDDSEDDLDGAPAEDDGPIGEMILCTWDKVNRVKNKWRCTLKDGILTTGGKEYVFHKATGEFEW